MIEALSGFTVVGCAGIAFFIMFRNAVLRGEENNFTTFILLAILCGIVAYEVFQNRVDFMIFTLLAIGSAVVAMVNLASFKWEIVDTISSVFVAVMIIIAMFVNDESAIWFLGIAIFFAGASYMSYLHFLPTINESIKIVNVLFLLSSTSLFIFAGTVGRNLPFASACFFYWLFVVAISLKQKKYDFLNQNKTPKA